MNTWRHTPFFSDGFRPSLSAHRAASALHMLAALACCCLLVAPSAGLAATAATPALSPRELPAEPAAAPAVTSVPGMPLRHAPAPVQETRTVPPPAAEAPAAGGGGLDEQGRAVWRTLETGLLFGEFQLNDGDAKLTVVRIDPAYFDFTLCARSQDGGPPRPLSQWSEQYDLAAAINASMYLPDRSTSTGYMRQGAHVNNGRVVQRFGAFFVAGPDSPSLPSAAILDRDAPQWRQNLDHYSLVIQNYRMINADRRILWSPGGPHYSISAVAQDGDGQILFMHCRQPVEAYAFAQQVLHLPLNVRTVMYVEGGGQAGLLVRSAALTQELGGLNPSDFLVTGDMRAVLPNILGARRKAAAAVDKQTPAAQSQTPAAPAAPNEATPQPQEMQPQSQPQGQLQDQSQGQPQDQQKQPGEKPAGETQEPQTPQQQQPQEPIAQEQSPQGQQAQEKQDQSQPDQEQQDQEKQPQATPTENQRPGVETPHSSGNDAQPAKHAPAQPQQTGAAQPTPAPSDAPQTAASSAGLPTGLAHPDQPKENGEQQAQPPSEPSQSNSGQAGQSTQPAASATTPPPASKADLTPQPAPQSTETPAMAAPEPLTEPATPLIHR